MIKKIILIVSAVGLASCGGPHQPVVSGSSGDSGSGTSGGSLNYDNQISKIFQARCVPCHAAGNSMGLPNWQDYNTAYSERALISKKVYVDRSMPPAGVSSITDDERRQIAAWVSSGAPKSASNSPTPTPTPPPPTTPPDFGPIKTQIDQCMSCHGKPGNSTDPIFPSLAGQQADYITAELKAFKSHQRGDPNGATYMWTVAEGLTDSQMSLLGQYFNLQVPIPNSPGDPALAAQGKVLFENGKASANVTACALCHGNDGSGGGSVPRLAGLSDNYLVGQLEAFRAGQRPEAQTMPPIVIGLNQDDERALAAYLQGLK